MSGCQNDWLDEVWTKEWQEIIQRMDFWHFKDRASWLKASDHEYRRWKMLLKSFKRGEKGIIHRTRPEHPIPDIQGFLVSTRPHIGSWDPQCDSVQQHIQSQSYPWLYSRACLDLQTPWDSLQYPTDINSHLHWKLLTKNSPLLGISSHSHKSLAFASSKFPTGNFEEGMLYQILLHALNVKFLFLAFIKRFFNTS